MLTTPAAAPLFAAATTSFDPVINKASSYNNHPIVHTPSTASDHLMHATNSDHILHNLVSNPIMHTMDHVTTDRITPSHNPDSNPTPKLSFMIALLTSSTPLLMAPLLNRVLHVRGITWQSKLMRIYINHVFVNSLPL